MAARRRRRSPSKIRKTKPAPRRAPRRVPRAPTAVTRAAKRIERRRRTPETLRLRAFSPGLTVSDLSRSLAFYGDVLGFVIADRWTDGGVLRGVMLKAGASMLGLSQDDWAKGRDRKKGEGVRIWCETEQDVDALAARVRAAGFGLTEEPKDQPWGARAFSFDDPDGFHLTISRKL